MLVVVMYKKLELLLIDHYHDPKSAKELTLSEAGDVIKKLYLAKKHEPTGLSSKPGLVVFDGPAICHIKHDLVNFVTRDKPLIVEGLGKDDAGLRIYTPDYFSQNGLSYVDINRRGNAFAIFSPKNNRLYVRIQSGDEFMRETRVYFGGGAFKKIKVYYVPHVRENSQRSELFWHAVAEHFGLELEEIDPHTSDSMDHKYTTTDPETRIRVRLETPHEHVIIAEFPKEQSAANLQKLVEGLTLNPSLTYTARRKQPIQDGLKRLEVYFDKGYVDQVLVYMSRLLQRVGQQH